MEPWGYSLRELTWRAEALNMLEWDRVAWTCFWIPRFGKKRYSLEDFHPIRKSMKADLGEVLYWIGKVGRTLPKTMTREEFDRRWEEFKKRGD